MKKAKRILVFAILAAMLLSLCGCKSKAAKETDELILKIGEVTASSTDEVAARIFSATLSGCM